MAETAHCGTCGKPVTDSSNGLCPSCLLRSAIEHGAGQALAPVLPRLHYFGDYELLEEIARGGMGVVYRARQISLDRVVAVKMMRPGLLATGEEIRRFHAEAKMAAGLQHPNVVAIHEVGEFDGLHYFSMDFVDGPNLAALVNERPLPSMEAARYVQVLAGAVEYAHSRGILHRDLKPSNVLVDAAGRPRITDFGLARPLESDSKATVNGAVVGTPAYMPPEQASGEHERLSPASDVYSLGAILYELLTGRPPFHGKTQVETVQQVLQDPPALLRKHNPEVDRGLEAICLRCLEKEPARRYRSAAELGAALARFLRHEPVERRKIWLPAVAAVFALMAIVAFFILRTRKFDRAAAPPVAAPVTAAKPAPLPPSAPPTVSKVPTAKPAPAKSQPPKSAPSKPETAVAISIAPNHGAGYRQNFEFRYTEAAGIPPIESVEIAFHDAGPAGPRDCRIFVKLDSTLVGLQYSPTGGPGLQLSGTSGTLAQLDNAVCTVDLSGVVLKREGQTELVRMPVVFQPAFDGPKEVRSWAYGASSRALGESSATWNVGPPK